MTKISLRLALALGAFFVVAITLAACGGSSVSVPGNAVAVIDGKPITKATYDRWAAITARAAASASRNAVAPDPPAYTQCVARLRKQAKPAKGQSAPSDTTLLAQCKAQEQQISQQAMSTVIQTAWIEGEAKKQGITVTASAVQQQLAQTKKQSFPTPAAYAKFLKQSGMAAPDVLERLRVQLLAQRIAQKIQQNAAPTSQAAIHSYYNQNKAQFALPPRRDLDIVLTRTKGEAKKARAAIDGGASWAAVAKKYSVDPASRGNGGLLRGVAKGQQDRALDQAAFSAKKAAVVGPVQGQFGWYVLRVVKVSPPKQTTLAQASGQIRQVLAQKAGQAKLAAFILDFQKRWKGATTCRAGYVAPLCKNAPTPQATSTAGGTVATPPQGGGSTTK